MPLPNFLIIGAPRCGTTSVFEWLRQHPDIYLPGVKEPSYFAFEDGSAASSIHSIDPYIRNWQDYVELFTPAGNRPFIGEASTLYLQVEMAPRRIKQRLGTVKMIVLLRDPSERAFSHFLLHRATDSEPIEDFRAAIEAYSDRREKGWMVNWDYISPGFYARHLENFVAEFGRDSLKIVFFDDLLQRTEATIREISTFIGVPAGFEFNTSYVHNAAKMPRPETLLRHIPGGIRKCGQFTRRVPNFIRAPMKRAVVSMKQAVVSRPKLAEEDRRHLINIYQSDIHRLEEMLNVNLSVWYDLGIPLYFLDSSAPRRHVADTARLSESQEEQK